MKIDPTLEDLIETIEEARNEVESIYNGGIYDKRLKNAADKISDALILLDEVSNVLNS